MAATVSLREEFTGGCTVNELVEFGARAVAMGLAGYNVQCIPVIQGGSGVLADINDLRNIRALQVNGPAPELR